MFVSLTQRKFLKNELILLEKFVSKEIDGREFEKQYLSFRRIKLDKKVSYTPEIDHILDDFFSILDSFISDENLYTSLKKESKKKSVSERQFNFLNINEIELRSKARIILSRLQSNRLVETIIKERRSLKLHDLK